MAVAALLFFERRDLRAGIWLSKPAASTAFLCLALSAGALTSPYGRAIFLGLVFSWFGDVLLIPRSAPRIFLLGVVSFLAGHVAYGWAFVARGFDARLTSLAVALAAAIGIGVLRWLWPHVEAAMRPAVVAYVAVISLMVAAAAGTFATGGNAWIPAGALGFYFSDLSVARDRFVAPAFANRLWGLPLYYAAQVLLAFSIAAERS